MGNIIAQRRQKSKGHIGVQLRLFEHSLNAGLCLLFEVWRWWDGQNLLSGLLEKKGKPIPSLLLAYAARGPLGAFTQTRIAETLEDDQLFEHYAGVSVKPYDLSRFLNDVRFPFEVFWKRAVAKLGTHKLTRCRPNGVLIVDDSALIKTGRKMAEVRKLFDHSKKQFARGISYVQLYYLDRAKQYPLFFELHSKRGRRPKAKPHRTAPIGKIRIALRLLDQAIAAGIRPKAVLFDAWFLGTAFLKELHKLRLPFVSRLSSNRNLIVNGRTVKTKRLLKQKQRYRYSRSLKARWFALPAILPGYGPVLVVCLKHKRRKTAIVSNLLSADPCALVELYRQRWAIETFFKEAKQVFGLDKFQNRKRHGILAHLVLTNLSCLLVALLKLLLPGARSMKLKMLFRSLFRIVADLTFQNGTLIIIIGKTRRWFAKTVSFFNDLQPLASTA